MTRADAIRHLGRKVYDDCTGAGWLRPRLVRDGAAGRASRIYALEDVLAVEDRILGGDYPTTTTPRP